MEQVTPSIITFLLGLIIGWWITHWYTVVIKRPELAVTGSGSGGLPNHPGVHVYYVSISNRPRHIGLSLPITVILGKTVPTSFGKEYVYRDAAIECSARLLDENNEFICNLWWLAGENVKGAVDIGSRSPGNLVIFAKTPGNNKEYLIYQPTSESDLNVKLSDCPSFDETKSFKLEVTRPYSGQVLTCTVEAKLNHNSITFSHITNDGSSSVNAS